MKNYTIKTIKSTSRNIHDNLKKETFFETGDLKSIYTKWYKWLRSQYCAQVTIEDRGTPIAIMMIGQLGGIIVEANRKLVTVRKNRLTSL